MRSALYLLGPRLKGLQPHSGAEICFTGLFSDLVLRFLSPCRARVFPNPEFPKLAPTFLRPLLTHDCTASPSPFPESLGETTSFFSSVLCGPHKGNSPLLGNTLIFDSGMFSFSLFFHPFFFSLLCMPPNQVTFQTSFMGVLEYHLLEPRRCLSTSSASGIPVV